MIVYSLNNYMEDKIINVSDIKRMSMTKDELDKYVKDHSDEPDVLNVVSAAILLAKNPDEDMSNTLVTYQNMLDQHQFERAREIAVSLVLSNTVVPNSMAGVKFSHHMKDMITVKDGGEYGVELYIPDAIFKEVMVEKDREHLSELTEFIYNWIQKTKKDMNIPEYEYTFS